MNKTCFASILLLWAGSSLPAKITLHGNISNLPGPDGQLISLSEVCAKNKLALLPFWRSTCSHCKEFEPVLAELYKKYHPLGVEDIMLVPRRLHLIATRMGGPCGAATGESILGGLVKCVKDYLFQDNRSKVSPTLPGLQRWQVLHPVCA